MLSENSWIWIESDSCDWISEVNDLGQLHIKYVVFNWFWNEAALKSQHIVTNAMYLILVSFDIPVAYHFRQSWWEFNDPTEPGYSTV